MKITTNTKLFKYCLALIPGIFALGIAPDAQALSTSVTGGNVVIPTSTFNSDLDVNVNSTPNFTIEDVTVTFTNLTHTWAGDLEMTLTNVSTGTSARIMEDPDNGGSSDFDGTYVFNDTFTNDLHSAVADDPISGGNYFPLDNFSSFDGELANGIWRLNVVDDAGGDGGGFDSWTLALSGPEASAAVPFEFSPGLGLLLVGACLGLKRGQDRWRKKPDKVHLS